MIAVWIAQFVQVQYLSLEDATTAEVTKHDPLGWSVDPILRVSHIFKPFHIVALALLISFIIHARNHSFGPISCLVFVHFYLHFFETTGHKKHHVFFFFALALEF